MQKFIVSFYRYPGRPLLEVSKEEVEYLRSLHFIFTRIAEIMGPDRGSIIAGKIVHNQRIERFWRDLYISCVHILQLILSSGGYESS